MTYWMAREQLPKRTIPSSGPKMVSFANYTEG